MAARATDGPLSGAFGSISGGEDCVTGRLGQPVHGFRLTPGKSFNMVLGVTATATGHADSRGMAIYYHDSAGNHVTSNHLAVTIGVTKRGCN